MRNFIIRLIVTALALAITAFLLPGIHVEDGILTLLLIAFVFGIVNAIIKPIITILSCPLIILTLGLFYLVVNGLMLLITDELVGSSFEVDGIWWAILGGLVLGVVGSILEGVLGVDEEPRDRDRVVMP